MSTGKSRSLHAILLANGVRNTPRRHPRRSIPVPSNTPAKTKKKKPKKRHIVGVGDLVAFHSYMAHMTGTVGEVTHVLDRDKVVVRALAAQYEQYCDSSWVVLTYKPRGTTPDGEDKADQTLWINKIIHRVTTPPTPKPPRQKKPAKVVAGLDGLAEALKSGEKHTEVVFVPDSSTP